MYLVDTHQHLWDLDQFPYSWTKGIARLHRSFRLGDYLEASAGLGIAKTIFMECDVDGLRPWFDHVIDCFGWDRVVWGGDWPVCTLSASPAQWVEASHQLVQAASASEQERLFHRNAERIYRV